MSSLAILTWRILLKGLETMLSHDKMLQCDWSGHYVSKLFYCWCPLWLLCLRFQHLWKPLLITNHSSPVLSWVANPPQELLPCQRTQLKDQEVQHTTTIPSRVQIKLIDIYKQDYYTPYATSKESDDKHRHDKFQGLLLVTWLIVGVCYL